MDNEEELNSESESDFDSVNDNDEQKLDSVINDEQKLDSNINDVNNDSSTNDLVNDEIVNQSSNESPQTDSSNLKDKLDENKNKGYEKANSDRDAYQRKLDNGKDYYKNQANNIKNEQDKLQKDKKNNSDRRDSAEKRLEQAKQNRGVNRNRETRSELREAKKESKEAKKESKELNKKEKNLKNDSKLIKKDSKKADRFKKMHPIEAAKMAAIKKLKKIRNLIIIKLLVPVTLIVLGIFLAIFVVYTLFSPVLEIFDKVDESVTNVSNSAEKFINWMKGFGYENTKDAFYAEVEDLNEKYDGEINIPLIMSTLYYTETSGYDTTYGDMESLIASDTGDIDGFSAEALWETVKQYVMEKLKDVTGETDENGIRYTTGKIVRMRKLARHQYNSSKFGDDSKGEDVKSDDNYKNYLTTYYIPTMPEFKKYLPSDTAGKEVKIQQIVSDIYSNEQIFRDIYLQYIDADSESYSEECVGAIDNSLVIKLGLPISIPDGTTISFSEKSSYGITTDGFHKGVDLNSTTAGVSAGSDVLAIADGTIENVGTSTSSNSSNTSISNYLFIGDSRYVGISDSLKALGQNNTVAAVTSSTPSQWEKVAESGSGTVISTKISLPATASGVSIMLGVNAVGQTSNLQNVINKLHTRYPDATIYVNSVYHVGKKYSGSVTNDMIDTFNKTMESWCNSNSWTTYVDVTNGLNGSDGYVKSEYMDSTGLHATGTGKSILVNNIKNSIGGSVDDTYGSWVKIKHNIAINNKEYNFYSVYNNLDSVTLKKGASITKGAKIGKIAKSENAGLHFEFHNDKDSAIDPTNLFIKCSSSTELVGNTNEEKTWNYLLSKGFTKVAAAGIIGNLIAETGLLPNNVEDASKAQSLLGDEKFTEMVDNGSISRSEFIKSSKYAVPKGWHGYNYDGYTYGYGLAQWTDPGRKTNFYDFWSGPKSGVSIGDLGMQLDFIMEELDKDYSSTKESVNKASTPTEAADIFWHYEVGAAKDLRRKYANQIYNQFANQ